MDHHSEQSHFIVPLKFYVGTFLTLLVLTFLTVAVSRLDLGLLNTPLALGIAIVKMSFVAIIFMGLRWDKGFNAIIFVGAGFCVVLFFLFTFADIAYRGDVSIEEKGIHGLKTPVRLIEPGHHPADSHH